MNRIAGRTFRLMIVTAASLILGAEDSPAIPPMPGLNVQLRFVCLSLADDRLGTMERSSLGDLPDTPPQTSLTITTSWHSGTRTATSDIRDTLGNNLHIEESIGTGGGCEGLPQDIFRLERVENNYESQFCITGPRPNTFPDVKVRMQLTGSNEAVDILRSRVFAIASCLPPSGTSMLEGGISVGRELIRTTADR